MKKIPDKSQYGCPACGQALTRVRHFYDGDIWYVLNCAHALCKSLICEHGTTAVSEEKALAMLEKSFEIEVDSV